MLKIKKIINEIKDSITVLFIFIPYSLYLQNENALRKNIIEESK